MKQNTKKPGPQNLPKAANIGQKQPLKDKSTPFISTKSVLLSIAFLVILLLIRQTKSYSYFYTDKIVENYQEMRDVRDIDNYMDIDVRKMLKWQDAYRILKGIRKVTQNDTNFILLVPPRSYLHLSNKKIEIPEPAVCYYYASLKTARSTSSYAYKCSHVLVVNNQDVSMIKIRSKSHIDSLLQVYKSYSY